VVNEEDKKVMVKINGEGIKYSLIREMVREISSHQLNNVHVFIESSIPR
jgi:hypothetical protein